VHSYQRACLEGGVAAMVVKEKKMVKRHSGCRVKCSQDTTTIKEQKKLYLDSPTAIGEQKILRVQ